MPSFYDHPRQGVYRFAAATLSGAAIVGRIIGPKGKIGRLAGFQYVMTTATTDDVSVVTLDTVAGLTAPATVDVPIKAINLGGAATVAEIAAGDEFPADTIITIASNGGSTAGAADLLVAIDWY